MEVFATNVENVPKVGSVKFRTDEKSQIFIVGEEQFRSLGELAFSLPFDVVLTEGFLNLVRKAVEVGKIFQKKNYELNQIYPKGTVEVELEGGSIVYEPEKGSYMIKVRKLESNGIKERRFYNFRDSIIGAWEEGLYSRESFDYILKIHKDLERVINHLKNI